MFEAVRLRRKAAELRRLAVELHYQDGRAALLRLADDLDSRAAELNRPPGEWAVALN